MLKIAILAATMLSGVSYMIVAKSRPLKLDRILIAVTLVALTVAIIAAALGKTVPAVAAGIVAIGGVIGFRVSGGGEGK